MSKYRCAKILYAATAISAFTALSFWPSVGNAQAINRLAAESNYFGFEASTTTTAASGLSGGVPVYRRSVSVPAGQNVIFATISTTGDVHDGAASCFTALLDGKFFNGGAQGSADCADGTGVPGWTTLLKVPNTGTDTNCFGTGDCHDNGIYYQWCKKVKPGIHEVQIRMASNKSGSSVFIEQAHFYVDSAKMPANACVKAVTPVAAGLEIRDQK